jgi:hypothetical protein
MTISSALRRDAMPRADSIFCKRSFMGTSQELIFEWTARNFGTNFVSEIAGILDVFQDF